jgi:hypothetical protein
MMFKRSGQHRQLCVLRIRPDVLYLDGVVLTDQNAASKYRRWGAFPDDLVRIDRDRIFAEWWTRYDDLIERYQHTSEMCAEALIPERVLPDDIVGAYVSCSASAAIVRQLAPGLPVTVNGYLFFFTSLGRSP